MDSGSATSSICLSTPGAPHPSELGTFVPSLRTRSGFSKLWPGCHVQLPILVNKVLLTAMAIYLHLPMPAFVLQRQG